MYMSGLSATDYTVTSNLRSTDQQYQAAELMASPCQAFWDAAWPGDRLQRSYATTTPLSRLWSSERLGSTELNLSESSSVRRWCVHSLSFSRHRASGDNRVQLAIAGHGRGRRSSVGGFRETWLGSTRTFSVLFATSDIAHRVVFTVEAVTVQPRRNSSGRWCHSHFHACTDVDIIAWRLTTNLWLFLSAWKRCVWSITVRGKLSNVVVSI